MVEQGSDDSLRHHPKDPDTIENGDCQPVLVQTPTQEFAVGQKVEIPCTLSTGLNFDIYRVIWLQQKNNNVIRMVYHFRTGNTQGRGPGIPDRFSVTDDVPKNAVNLTIKQSMLDDEADYYCGMWHPTITGVYIFGDGTELVVNSGEVKAPSVFMYQPSNDELKTDKATIVCTMSDFTPRIASVEWTVDGSKWTTGIYSSPISKQADSTYMGSSFLSLASSEYTKHDLYSCKVTHQGKEIIQTLKRSECS
ncbi:immunoglobulin lambda-1 light chain-like [Rhinoderma darwinii]|uniref:immunoglobulin lambda-1 light chain-like n=1 Tax=Rhinoderma darwinii TaxID=43563 RepID=UPI003F66AA10